MSVWPLVNKLKILQGSTYNQFDFMELDSAPFFFLKDDCCLVEECDCAYVSMAEKGICHEVPGGHEPEALLCSSGGSGTFGCLWAAFVLGAPVRGEAVACASPAFGIDPGTVAGTSSASCYPTIGGKMGR